MKIRLALAILILLFLPALVSLGCKSSTEQKPRRNETPGKEVSIDISNFKFNPGSLSVDKGEKVTWTNNDSTTHTVTADSGDFDKELNPGEKYSKTFNETGTFSYKCSLHPSMTAEIIVR